MAALGGWPCEDPAPVEGEAPVEGVFFTGMSFEEGPDGDLRSSVFFCLFDLAMQAVPLCRCVLLLKNPQR